MQVKKQFLFISFLFLTLSAFTQAQWEWNVLRHNYHPYKSGDMWRSISNTAKPLAVAIPVGMFAVALITKNKNLEINSYETVAGLAIAAGATYLMKETIKRPRPYLTDTTMFFIPGDINYSFPSGHVSVVAASATSLIIATKKWYVAVPAIAWVGCVGYSRIYMGEHYPSDVIGGIIVGAGGALAANWLNRKFFLKKKKIITVP
ncbi:MAG: phosphatase family protein [Sediminibacterium sp.]|nr:phosphatase family protein [Sediminibacterium sp.]